MTLENATDVRGIDLRMYRLSRRLSLVSVAREFGASPQRCNAIESSDRPTAATRERYWAAILAADRSR